MNVGSGSWGLLEMVVSWSLVPLAGQSVERKPSPSVRPRKCRLSNGDDGLAEASEAESRAALGVARAGAADRRAAGRGHAAASRRAGAGTASRVAGTGRARRRARRLAKMRRGIADAPAALRVRSASGAFTPACLSAKAAALRIHGLVADIRAAAAPRPRRTGLAGGTAIAVREVDLALPRLTDVG